MVGVRAQCTNTAQVAAQSEAEYAALLTREVDFERTEYKANKFTERSNVIRMI